MAGSDYIYRFIESVWDFLPKKDRNRFAELWKGYEQVYADALQRFFELDQSLNVNTMPVFLTSRWNKYKFDSTTANPKPAQLRAFQDLTFGVNLTNQFLLRISINGQTPIEVDCRGLTPAQTTLAEIISAINRAFGFVFATPILENSAFQLTTRLTGPTASIELLPASDPSRDATELLMGYTPEELPLKVPRYPHIYRLPDQKIAKIPSLQNSIRNENLKYYVIDGPDFIVNRAESLIEFKDAPPENMWAKVTYINEETPFFNFGYLIDYVDSSIKREDYLLNLQGLWFAFWQGARPEFIRRSLYLLFGLPVAVRNGVVLSRSETVIEILHDDNVIRTYSLPGQLNWLVDVGNYVERFQPLVDGIDVFDKVNLPGFVRTEIGRDAIQIFALPEATRGEDPNTDESKALIALEEHTFLPQINVNAFVRPNINIGTIFSFLRNIKPLQKAFYFQVIVAIFNEELLLNEVFGYDYKIDVTPNLDLNQANTSSIATQSQYEDFDMPAMDLDSDTVGIFERGGASFSDITGPLPDFDVVFD